VKRVFAKLLIFLARPFDLLQGPRLADLLIRALARTSPLSDPELEAGKRVLGADAVRWDRVRVAEGGALGLAFRINGGRAFTTFHTINLPVSGDHTRARMDIVVHELVHVLQFECVGSAYAGQALLAQETGGYKYGEADGLRRDRAAGKKLRDYNREQQGQIAQDYYRLSERGSDTADYEPFIDELRARAV
jgi:hypothetical protein